MTGIAASGPMSPSPRTALPSDTTATVLRLIVYWKALSRSCAIASHTRVAPEALSRVSSYDWAVSLVFMPIGFALWGPISDLVGVDTAFVAAALVSAAAKVGPVLVPDVRNLRRADAPPSRASQATT